ncbi:excinuclease ABC subunit UvrB [Patescibacteria group bacterium]|nr:excinuclease ABC subunit UvrB [Patescibacteria group bacterium]
MKFVLKSQYQPTGDQPNAINQLAANLNTGTRHQTLLGVTGSGKTFTMANVIERIQKPTLVISHNKTLAAQLYQEFKEFFPENAVHYFVSYYDYYQPEAYIPQSDTYIEKDAKINEMIDSLRHAATADLLTRNDVIIVASVSCIYGIGGPEEYEKASVEIKTGQTISQKTFARDLVLLQYNRNDYDPKRGEFRMRGNKAEIYLPSGEEIIDIEFLENKIISIKRRSSSLNSKSSILNSVRVFPAKHFVTPQTRLKLAVRNIKKELRERLAELKKRGHLLEAERLKQRTDFDMEMLEKTGYVNGIENYSRHLDFREPGTPPHTLLDYFRYRFGENFLTVIDESHASIPQIRGMYHGDKARKTTLVEYGFRLPSAIDNRPLTFEEFNRKIAQVAYVSATPDEYELENSKPHIIEQLIRPTGILDPELEVRPTKNQIKNVIAEIKKRIAKKERSLVMALTKRLAEDIAEYLTDAGIKAEYLHSEIKTFDRSEVLKKLRTGEHDVIVGINLLREGLDLPEVSFIAILDADKEGFLRNETTLLQIIGRASRHIDGKVILYADAITGSMRVAINETRRRRAIQEEYNREHNITPKQIIKAIRQSILEEKNREEEFPVPEGPIKEIIASLEKEMKKAAKELNFELAAQIRNQIKKMQKTV